MANGNPFYVDPMGVDNSQFMTGLGNIVQQNRDKQQAQAQQQQKQSDVIAALRSRDPDRIMEMSFKYPDLSDKIYETAGIRDDQQKSEFASFARDILTSSPEQIPAKYERRIQQIQARGGDPSKSVESYQDYKENSKDELRDLEAFFAGAEKEQYKALKSSTGDVKQDLPAEAVVFNDLIKDFTPEQQDTAKLVKAGLKGHAVSNAVLSAIESGDITKLSEAKAEIKQAEKFAEMTGSSRAKAIDKGFDSIVKIDAGIRNIDRAISAVDSGAGVGAVEKLWPSIKAASVELDNIRGQMALDVVGATTFGALSKGELDLAKDIALPTGLDGPELTEYLTKKKAAQEKLKAYYSEQIQFLDQGGTVAGFLRQKEAEEAKQMAAEVEKTVSWSDL